MKVRMLGELNIDEEERTGIFIEATWEELLEFQKRHNLFDEPSVDIVLKSTLPNLQHMAK